MYLEAVELMEDDGQDTMALDMFRQAIGMSPLLCTSSMPHHTAHVFNSTRTVTVVL